MAKSTMRKIALSLLPLAVIMGVLVYGSFELGQHNPGRPIVEAQEGPTEPLYTGHGWLVKSFNQVKLDSFFVVKVTGPCIIFANATLLEGESTVTVVQFGDGIRHTYGSPAQVRVCGNIVHLPPSIIPASLDDD